MVRTVSARPTVVLFDVDGTLITCGGAGRRAMEAAYREEITDGAPPHFPFAGGTDRAIARRFLTEGAREATDEAIEAFLGAYLRHLPGSLAASERYRVFDGVHELLEVLEAMERVAIGLGTGNIEPGAYAKLGRGGIDARFGFGGFGSDHEERPRLIEAGAQRGAARLGVSRGECRVVVIGDTLSDVEAARAIGAECIGVGTGPLEPEQLRAGGAQHAYEDLSAPELRAILTAPTQGSSSR